MSAGLQGSFIVIFTSETVGDGSQISFASQRGFTFTILWFGGQRIRGIIAKLKFGGVVSSIVMVVSLESVAPALSVTSRMMVCVPSGRLQS